MNKTTFIKLTKKIVDEEVKLYGGKIINLGYYKYEKSHCINYLHIVNSACYYRIHIEDTTWGDEIAVQKSMLTEKYTGKYSFIDIETL